MPGKCGECRAFVSYGGGSIWGTCHAHPPTLIQIEATLWPEVNEDDGCWEFVERDTHGESHAG